MGGWHGFSFGPQVTRPVTSNGLTGSHLPTVTGNMNADELFLSSRTGLAPDVTKGIPHIQLDQTASDELLARMTDWVFSIPKVVEQPSRTSLPGARALTVAPDVPVANQEAIMVGREFAHIHPQPHGGSMHMKLPVHQVTEVVDKGWGEQHPLALNGSIPNLLMVYAPRDEEDLAVIKIIINAAVEYATANRT
jgi:hypothetical protein